MPQTARCPKARGGCGKLRKVPRTVAPRPRPAALASAVTVWDPPSEPRRLRPAADPCPHCGEASVYAEPRGTIRACLGCRKRVIPPGVLAPYERGAETTRAAKSQRERDLEALGLAGRKGVMLGQLRALADGDRLDPASALQVEWFAEQVKAAAAGVRLDELAALFGEAGIRPRRWWHQRPAALTAGYADDEDGYDDDGEDQADEPEAPALATPASIAGQQHRAQPQRKATWAGAFSAYRWHLVPQDYSGSCQVVTSEGRCREPTGGHPPITDGIVPNGWACDYHYGALSVALNAINQQRGLA